MLVLVVKAQVTKSDRQRYGHELSACTQRDKVKKGDGIIGSKVGSVSADIHVITSYQPFIFNSLQLYLIF